MVRKRQRYRQRGYFDLVVRFPNASIDGLGKDNSLELVIQSG